MSDKKEASFRFISGVLTEEEIHELYSSFEKIDIELKLFDIRNRPQMAAFDLIAPFVLTLSNDIYVSYFINIASSISFEIIKTTVLKIWRSLQDKTYNEIHSDGKIIENKIDMDLTVNLNNGNKLCLRLSNNISDDLKAQAIAKAFSALCDFQPQKEHELFYGIFNVKKNEWEIFHQMDFINRKGKKKS